MFELYSADTPNGKKISIMLEELKLNYKVKKINIMKGEQFKPSFSKISPFNKIPVLKDIKEKKVIFESGAILIYLGEKYKKFYDKKDRLKILQWLMAQMAYIGPMIGQHHQFHHYNSGKSKFGEERYFRIARTIYKDLDRRLSKSKYLAGGKYSIADIATFPWIARHEWHDIGLKKHRHLSRWYKLISKRKAVIRGYDFMNRGELVPKV
ncbi:MAG: glutathione S-transferase [Pelagibacteraceae bacterium]|nr:glutathione S-transferase [Pelagibacteraceae bacterium]MCI5078993.1 glutathione S-transferase [Pelagibacteraceae bacterium]